MRDILVAAIVFGSLPLILKFPHIGVLVWSWLSYMSPHRLGWGFAYDFPFAQIVAIVTFISLLVTKEPRKIPIYPATVVWILFNLWMGATTLFAISTEVAVDQWIKVLKIQLFTLITLMLIRNRERLTLLIWVVVVSIGFFGVKGGVFTLLSGGGYRVYGPPGSFIGGNNEVALALLMVIPLAYYLRDITANVWVRWGLLAAMGLMALSAAGSQSRGAFLAGGAVFVYLWLKSKNKVVTGVVGVMLTIGILAFMPDTWHRRMDTIDTYQEDASAMGRINAWTAAYRLALDRFTGGGFDGINLKPVYQQYAPTPEDYHDSHSIYFEVLGDHGFPGLILFLTLGILTFTNGRRIIRLTEGVPNLKWLNSLARMVQVSLIAYATGGAFLGLAYFDLFYGLVAISLLGRALAEREARARLEADRATLPLMTSPAVEGSMGLGSQGQQPSPSGSAPPSDEHAGRLGSPSRLWHPS